MKGATWALVFGAFVVALAHGQYLIAFLLWFAWLAS